MQYKPTILYVEDEEGIRENVKRPLQYFSNELFVACDGQEGLDLYKKHHPDIVVTDIKMPNMDGIAMSRAIKKINPKQYIVITTAHSESHFFIDAIEMHIDAYILKPIDIDLLEKKIAYITERIKVEKELANQIVLTQEISQLQDNCLVVLGSDNSVIFANSKFLKYYNVKDVEEFIKKYKCLNKLFVQHDDYLYPEDLDDVHWVEQLQKIDDEKRLVAMEDDNGEEKIFLLSLKHIENTLHTIITFTEVTVIESQKKEFEKKAYIDELTQIHNRAYFEKEFLVEMAKYRADKTPLSFMILDIDHFKNINDTYGHQVGDDILSELAQIIKKKTRKDDIFARWGGEEFVKVLPNATTEEAMEVAQNLRETIEAHLFKDNLKITCSFGLASFSEDDEQKSVMKRADDALYRAKKSGRNRVEYN
ncbi:MAG: diguanylate cyclase [Campylobacterota bacterium]|nr:diguanylate cyclase [Campylobacterota bacterium]